MTLAHAGLAVAMAGMIGVSVWKAEVVSNLRPGEAVEIAGYSLLFEGVGRLQGPNYTAERARFPVSRGGDEIAQMFTDKRLYHVRPIPTTDAPTRPTFLTAPHLLVGAGAGPRGVTAPVDHRSARPWLPAA